MYPTPIPNTIYYIHNSTNMTTSLELVTTQRNIYKPYFNENTGKYQDICPYKQKQYICDTYICRCKALAHFSTRGGFNQHIKSKCHQDFINNYTTYFKEVDEAEARTKEHLIQLELLTRRNRQLAKAHRDMKEKEDMRDTREREYQEQLSDKRDKLQLLLAKNNDLENIQSQLREENKRLSKERQQLQERHEHLAHTQTQLESMTLTNKQLNQQLYEYHENLDQYSDALCSED